MAKLPIPFNNPNTYAGHSGVDYPVKRGTSIPASGPGRVASLSRNEAGGFYIWVKYDAITPQVGYHHMDSHNGCPPVGTRVSEGSRLGYVGSTGNSTGPHLHSEVAGHRTTDGYWQFFDRNRVVGSAPKSNQDTKNRQEWLNRSRGEKLAVDGIQGAATTAAIKRYQTFLKQSYGYTGAVDGIWGNGTQSAHQKFYNVFNKPKPNPAPAKPSNPFGIPWCAGLQKIAKLYGYKGAIDQIWGAGSAAGFAQFLRKNWGYSGNDVLGPVMWASIARWLRSRWGYSGNDVPGPVMRSALQRAEAANYKEL